MAFSITGVRRAPDVGFTSATRQTAEGAHDLAVAFVADGMQEVEIRDASGALCDLRNIDHSRVYATGESKVVARLAAI